MVTCLILGSLSGLEAVVAVIALQQHPNSREKMLELSVVGAAVPIELFLSEGQNK